MNVSAFVAGGLFILRFESYPQGPHTSADSDGAVRQVLIRRSAAIRLEHPKEVRREGGVDKVVLIAVNAAPRPLKSQRDRARGNSRLRSA